MSNFSYPKRCCNCVYPPGQFGTCRTARDPELCRGCEEALKRFNRAKRKERAE